MITRIWDVTLTVSDLKRSVFFYEQQLGLIKKYEFKDYAGFDVGGVELGLKTWGDCDTPRKGEPCINFLVDDVDGVHKILISKGVSILKEPTDTQWGSRMIYCEDPDRHIIQLTSVKWAEYFKVCAPK